MSTTDTTLLDSLTPAQRQLVDKMEQCWQTPGYSTLQHGLDCFENYWFITTLDLLHGWRWNEKLFKMPEWLEIYAEKIYENLHPFEIAKQYITFHDCGKWACQTTDAEGKRHFPDHAETSARIYRDYFGDEGDHHKIGHLIKNDMAIHTMKDADIDRYLSEWTTQDACTLLLASLSEIHANATLFGGIDSVNFKIKFKQISKRGLAICKKLFGDIS